MKQELIQTSISVCTGTYAVFNIQDVLSIVILVLSILNILWNLGYKIYKHVKNKELDKIDDEFKKAIEELNDRKE